MTVVLGFTGRELPVVSKFNTFCNLCSHQIKKGEECLTETTIKDEVSQQWFYHTDCVIAKLTSLHVLDVREAKVKKGRKKTYKNKPKVRQGDGTKWCKFCKKTIASDQTYILKNGKPLHNVGIRANKAKGIVGRPSCMSRYNRTMEKIKSSID